MVSDGYQQGTAAGIELVAMIQFNRGELERALNLLGGAGSVLAAIGYHRWPEQSSAVESVLDGARAELGEAECDRLLSEGASLSLERLVALASE